MAAEEGLCPTGAQAARVGDGFAYQGHYIAGGLQVGTPSLGKSVLGLVDPHVSMNSVVPVGVVGGKRVMYLGLGLPRGLVK